MTGLILIYIFRGESRTPELPSHEHLSPDRLLVEPIMTNRLPWSRGYFETVGNQQLRANDRLPSHSFRDLRGRYYDEHDNELERPAEPVGQHGVHSFRTIDDLVSDALGIPRAPE